MHENSVLKLSSINELVPPNYTGVAEWPNGTKRWYRDGKRHREDGPAVILQDGSSYWFLHDEVQAPPEKKEKPKKLSPVKVIPMPPGYSFVDDRKPTVLPSGVKERVHLPILRKKTSSVTSTKKENEVITLAELDPIPDKYTGKILYPTRAEWRKHGHLHRLNGPAKIYHDKDSYMSFYLDGMHYGSLPRKLFSFESIIALEKFDNPLDYTTIKNPILEYIGFAFTGRIIHDNDEGFSFYYKGKLHRVDGPALELFDGTQKWYKHGKLHCLDGPAQRNKYIRDWEEQYWIDGKEYSLSEYEKQIDHKLFFLELNNEKDISTDFSGILCLPSGTRMWFKEGKYHRKFGPAIEHYTGKKEFYIDGVLIKQLNEPEGSKNDF